MVHVVVIERADADAQRSARVLCTNAGYVTFTATTGSAGQELAQRIQPDVVVLDTGVSEPAGDVVLRHLQRRQRCPIVVVESRAYRTTDSLEDVQESAAVPFTVAATANEDLVTTIEVAVGAWRDAHVGGAVQYGDLVLDLRYEQVFTSGRRVPLAPRLFRLLTALVLVSGQPILVDELAAAIGAPMDGKSRRRSVQDAASKLRRALRVSGSRVAITWEGGTGYRAISAS